MTNLEKVEYKVTDLEALEMIVSDLTPKAKEHNKEEIEQIKKSLEGLDILKEKLYYDNKNHVIKMKEIRKSTRNFDYEYLKEWLENDK